MSAFLVSRYSITQGTLDMLVACDAPSLVIGSGRAPCGGSSNPLLQFLAGANDWTATTTLAAQQFADTAAAPECIRLPIGGHRELKLSLCRSTWNGLVLPCRANNFRPPVKSISVRRPGAIRGIRMISIPSARAYFQGLLDETEAADRNIGETEEQK